MSAAYPSIKRLRRTFSNPGVGRKYVPDTKVSIGMESAKPRNRPTSSLTPEPIPANMKRMRHRFTKRIPKLKADPYVDGSLTFRSLMWHLYKDTISCTEDERPYSNGLVHFLKQNAVLVEDYNKLESDVRDEDETPFYAGGFTLYLWRDNLITIKQKEDELVNIDCYYPTSRPCIIGEFKRFLVKEKGESRISVLASRNGGLVANKITFAAPTIPDIEMNYGTGFKKVYDTLIDKLREQRGGLILLHGTPGTGKTFLLKHLTSIVDREFVFVGASMIPRLSDPELISLLLNKKGAVLILEDAEQAIQKRTESNDASTTSTILNLTEGFLSSVLGLTVVASYNIDSSQVDEALLRRGRLLYRHSFSKLSKEDAVRLVKHLGKNIEVDGPMTLADVYNAGEESGYGQKVEPPRQMGFHTLIHTTGTTPKDSGPQEKKPDTEKT